jgi:phosphoserine phosphatase
VRKTAQLDYAFANNLQEDADGALTGATVIAVGYGADDIPMLKCAGLGVAFCAKPMVQKKANHCINQKDLRNIA